MERLEDCPPPFWLSWWHTEQMGAFELHSPWWVTGHREDGAVSICAAVVARSKIEARFKAMRAYDALPDQVQFQFRFCEQMPDDWSPFNDRFPQADWMEW